MVLGLGLDLFVVLRLRLTLRFVLQLGLGQQINPEKKMSVNDYPIRYSVNTETTLEEPIVGEWYCGFNIIGDENDEDADTYEKYQEGDICVYVGDGIFEDEESEEFLFTDYDFLIKQA